jgi:outer membrane protein insertion porin family
LVSGAYNQDRGIVPFERFYVGGDGLANFAMDGEKQLEDIKQLINTYK